MRSSGLGQPEQPQVQPLQEQSTTPTHSQHPASSPDDSTPRPPLHSRVSSGSSTSSSSTPLPAHLGSLAGVQQQQRSPAPPTPQRRLSGVFSSSPLSTSSSVSRRRRQDSFSSAVSTDATSYESGDEGMSNDGDKDCTSSSALAMSSAPNNTSAAPLPKRSSNSLFSAHPGSQEWMASGSTTSSSTSSLSSINVGASPSGAISIPPPSSLPISISTSVPPASVRLSTTPLFPSPLAQASGPEEDQSKADDGDGESEEEDQAETWGRGAAGRKSAASPLVREAIGPFGDIDISPTPQTIGLPDVGSLSINTSPATPRPQGRSAHRRSPSARDSSPEVEASRTARSTRIRSIGGRAGSMTSVSSISSSGDEGPVGRRRSHVGEAGFGSPTLDTSRAVAQGSSISSSVPRSSSNLSSSFSSSSPPSPSTGVPANSISRRASINLVSPPRTFAPSSPTLSRSSRSVLSAQLASPSSAPYPAAPPPAESIKLQKVPESVRSAMDFRQPASKAYTGELFSLPNPGLASPASLTLGDIRLPKTPTATRAPSPASGSGSVSPASMRRSNPNSQPSSRGPSRGPSRQPSREQLSSPPTSSPLHLSSVLPSSSASSTSAFSPLFPFPATSTAPSSTGPSRTRSKSVYQLPATQAIPSPPSDSFNEQSDRSSHDLGVSPLSLGLSPIALGSQPGIRRSNSQRSGQGLLANHRMSLAGAAGLGASAGPSGRPGGNGENTDEYAQIILASRNAKMRKWKTSTGSSEGGHARSGSWAGEAGPRRGLSTFGEAELVDEADITDGDGVGFGLGVGSKEFEWVDWLDEYRKMKEAKLAAEGGRVPEDREGEEAAMTSLANSTSPARTAEYNPFEATTAGLSYGGSVEGFLTPDPPKQHQPFTTSATASSWNFQPKPTSAPTAVPVPAESAAPLSRTMSRSSGNAVSPGMKRRRNFNKLGTKIDAWWSAVRSSFTLTPEEESHASRDRARRTSMDAGAPAMLAPVASRTSSTFTRPAPAPRPSLRNVASAQDLSRPPSTQPHSLTPPQESPQRREQPQRSASQVVPTGALAPGARTISTGRLVPPKLPHRSSSNSSADSDSAPRSDSRKRNPGLSLNLGPSFNSMVQPRSREAVLSPSPTQQKTAALTDSSLSPSVASANASSRFFSPPLPTSSLSATPSEKVKLSSSNKPWPAATPGLSPGHPPLWDRTPDVVPVSTHFPLRNVPAVKSLKETKESKAAPNFSMHTVRQQIRLRLVSAKENCDKELRKIIHGISQHVEMELHKNLASTPAPEMLDDGRFNEITGEGESLFAAYGGQGTFDMDSESEALVDTDDAGDEVGHTDSEGGTSRPPSRSKGALLSPGTSSSGTRRPSRGAATRPRSPRRSSLAPRPRKRNLTSAPRAPDFSGYTLSESRDKSGSPSAASSRSNSRSRSPLPLGLRNVSNGSRSPALSSQSNPPGSIAQSAFIVLLQEIITVATEILDTPVTKLTSQPGSCAEYIQRVQAIGKAWDDNPELACRGWYVQLLLAVAGLSRVLEWWEAERGFWTFDDNDDVDAEPILFVAKPTTEESPEVRARGDSYSSSVGGAPLTLPGSKWSPLGIDLGVPAAEEGGEEDLRQPADSIKTSGESTEQHAEALRQTVEEIRSSTLLMELSLDGQLFQFLSSAWEELTGINPSECLDTPISDFVYPDDQAVFAEATRQLEADDSHTVEVSFRLRVASSSQTSSNENEGPEDLYEAMEGKGMLMLDSVSGRPSHTMWVVRPAPLALDSAPGSADPAHYGFSMGHRRSASDPVMIFGPTAHLSVEPVLCRICERATPVWFFEKHNETCNETHRLEGDIGDCNDRLKELLRTIDDIAAVLDDEGGAVDPAEYRGIPLVTAAAAPTPPTYLGGLKPPLATKSNQAQIKKAQHRILDSVHEVVQTAISISTPSVLDETGDVPIQEQRLLSPHSENSLAMVMGWQRPSTDEAALTRLVADTEEQIRFKLNSVNRLRNTILYAEKVRQEWEHKANEVIARSRQHTQHQQQSWENQNEPFDSPALQPMPSTDESPRLLEGLDMATARPTQGLRRHSSHLFGMASPNLSPMDGLPSSFGSPPVGPNLLSPRIPSGVPSSRTKASSIKDFKILKPISKGAFGSVYLAKKITTGDYYAIKTLKKSDMVAKNQVTNVKAERMILMTQTESDFVVKLYYTFQSKDYLYLVMEYLNGGDCAALVKNLGELPEEWARRYIAEVIVGLEYLHASGIVHRDLKPDNLLIDAKGHLKLTDFGLSRIGLLGRQTQMPSSTRDPRRPSNSARSASRDPNLSGASSPSSTPANALGQSPASYFGSLAINDSFSLDTPSSQSGSNNHQNPQHKQLSAAVDSLAASRAAMPPPPPPERVGRPAAASDTPPKQAFVGTPDYLAPESILGIGTDATVDWWALGVICYEFLYGFPPFHDETPEKVFENILSRKIEWHEDAIEISPDARDFMERLLCSDAKRRLGANGSDEVKAHPWLDGVDWDNLLNGEVDFVPAVTDPENTDYFDARGATTDQIFAADDLPAAEELMIEAAPTPSHPKESGGRVPSRTLTPSTSASRQTRRSRSETEPSPHDDFGTFTFRNLTVLKQANDDVIRKMRDEQLLPPVSALESPVIHSRPLALGAKVPKSRTQSVDIRDPSSPSSPSSSSSSNPSRPTAPSSPYTNSSASHSRRPSEVPGGVDRLRSRQPSLSGGSHSRRNSLPSRLRTKSVSEIERPPIPESWGKHERRRTATHTPPGSDLSSPIEGPEAQECLAPLAIPEPEASTPQPSPSVQAVSAPPVPAPVSTAAAASRLSTIDCLVAGRNPIVTKVLETMLIRLGCRCVVVPDGGEAILAAQGVAFDVIFCDLAMPVVDGETAARMIKSTSNPSQNCPIVALCSHASTLDSEVGTLFSGLLNKPIMKSDLLAVFSKLGFVFQRGDERRGSGDDSRRGSESRRGSAPEATTEV